MLLVRMGSLYGSRKEIDDRKVLKADSQRGEGGHLSRRSFHHLNIGQCPVATDAVDFHDTEQLFARSSSQHAHRSNDILPQNWWRDATCSFASHRMSFVAAKMSYSIPVSHMP